MAQNIQGDMIYGLPTELWEIMSAEDQAGIMLWWEVCSSQDMGLIYGKCLILPIEQGEKYLELINSLKHKYNYNNYGRT